MADTIFKSAQALLGKEHSRGPFRLIGTGLTQLEALSPEADIADLLDPSAPKRFAAEKATDVIRARFGDTSIQKGRSWRDR
jgi:DNA polymerase-4